MLTPIAACYLQILKKIDDMKYTCQNNYKIQVGAYEKHWGLDKKAKVYTSQKIFGRNFHMLLCAQVNFTNS